MEKPEIISLFKFFAKFPDEESARLHLEAGRWRTHGTFCPHCGGYSVSEVKNHKPMPYRCKDCRKHFSVRTGTVLEETRLPLLKWLTAIFMMTAARKGISSSRMAEELGITQKSAWFLARRIRAAWLNTYAISTPSDSGPLAGELEVDETFVGGKESKKRANKSPKLSSGTVDQAFVIGMKQGNGKVFAKPIADKTGEPCTRSSTVMLNGVARFTPTTTQAIQA